MTHPLNLAEPVREEKKWHSWKEKWPEQRSERRHRETALKEAKAPQFERREGQLVAYQNQ